MTLEPKRDSVSIVVLGTFNPAILSPAWFALNDLLPESAAEEADVHVVHKSATEFTSEWLHLTCTQDRFAAQTTDPSSFPLVRDLVVGVFELLPHTPTGMIGLNRNLHYELESEEKWHDFGHHVIQDEKWKKILPPGHVGLKTLFVEGERGDELEGRIRIKMEPSALVKNGVYLQYNDHYVLSSEEDSAAEPSTHGIAEVLGGFDAFLDRSGRTLGEALESFR